MKTEETYLALLNYCSDGSLEDALGKGYEVVESVGDEWSCCSREYNTIYRASDGRIIHAECGGSSCGHDRSWTYADSVEAARLLIPEGLRR